jgi:indolepyruvate decarboxylase
MTGMELSNLVRHQMPVIVIILNNGGYGTERLLHPGEYAFNNVHNWQYHLLPTVLGGGTGYQIKTEGDFDQALTAAWGDTTGPSILHVHLDPQDCSRALQRMAAMMSRTVTVPGE